MYNTLIKLGVLLNIKQVDLDDIVKWSSERNFEMLIFMSDKGSIQNRKKAINHLGRLIKYPGVKKTLIRLMDDPILSVATHASDVLQSHVLHRYLERDAQFNEAYTRMCDRIEHQDNIASYYSSVKSSKNALRTSKKDMKRLEAVRKALRRPIR